MEGLYIEDKTNCWVYISITLEKKYRIGCSLNPPQSNDAVAGEEYIVWQKEFSGIANAFAHKLFLENISPASLRNIIKRVPSVS